MLSFFNSPNLLCVGYYHDRSSLYLCDNKFHTEALSELLEADQRFGFIVMDGNGTLFGTLSGNTREVIQKFTVDLPKKHGRGGQSALRFSRLRDEKRHNYVRKVAELAVQHFITSDKVNVTGLVLAGSADFKTELSQSDMFDPRLAAKVIKVVDVSYGGENGFNQVWTWHIIAPLIFILIVRYLGHRTRRRVPRECQVRSGEEAYSKVLR